MSTLNDPAKVQLPRASKGKRPYFFEDQNIDQVMTFFLELMTEVMVLRDRQDTVERLLDERGVIHRADIESFATDGAVEAERGKARDAFVKRVLRIHDVQQRQTGEPSAP